MRSSTGGFTRPGKLNEPDLPYRHDTIIFYPLEDLDHASEKNLMNVEDMRHNRPVVILLVFLLAAMVIIPLAGAASDKNNPNHENNKNADDCPADNGNGNAYGAWEHNWKCYHPVSLESATAAGIDFVSKISSQSGDFADWNGATVVIDTTYYDLNGRNASYSYEVLANGQHAGYVMVSATRDNYPILEFAKGITPNSDATIVLSARDLAQAEANNRGVTIGEGKPVYAGATFYYMSYPVDQNSKRSEPPKISDDWILVDLYENQIVNLGNAINTTFQLNATEIEASKVALVQKRQEANAEWAAFENQAAVKMATSSILPTQGATLSEDIIQNVENLNAYPVSEGGGCVPTSSAMVLGYYRDNFYCNRFPVSNYNPQSPTTPYLKRELYDAMRTDSIGNTAIENIKPGLDIVINSHHYQINTIYNSIYNFNEGVQMVHEHHPYILQMAANPVYGSHAVAAVGWREQSLWGIPTKYIVANDAHMNRNVNIRNGDWLWARAFWIIPIEYTITPNAGPNGFISPPSQTVIGGADSQPITVSANSGYVIESVTISDGTTKTDAIGRNSYPFTIHNVRQNLVVTATFNQISTSSIVNGGFEEGLYGWDNINWGYDPTCAHPGVISAAYRGLGGGNSLSQNIDTTGASSIRFWYSRHSHTTGDLIVYLDSTEKLRITGTGSGSPDWYEAEIPVPSSGTHKLEFYVAGYSSWTNIDDVQLIGPGINILNTIQTYPDPLKSKGVPAIELTPWQWDFRNETSASLTTP